MSLTEAELLQRPGACALASAWRDWRRTLPDGEWGVIQREAAALFREYDLPTAWLPRPRSPSAWFAPMWAVDLWGQKWRLGDGWRTLLPLVSRSCWKLPEAEARERAEAFFAAFALGGEEAVRVLAGSGQNAPAADEDPGACRR